MANEGFGSTTNFPKLKVKFAISIQADERTMIIIVHLFLFFALSSVVFATDKKSNPIVPSTNRLAEIQQKYKEAEAAYYTAAEPLPDTPEGNKQSEKLWEEFDKKQADLFMAAVELTQTDPKSGDGFAALEWVLTIPRAYSLSAGIPAMELVTAHHAANPKVGKIIAWVGYYTPDPMAASYAAAIALIQTVAEKNPNRAARGQAVMSLAWQARKKFAEAAAKKAPEENTLAAEAETAFETVVRDYADCPRLMKDGQRTLGEEAKQELYELRNLRVGKVAPDIEGQDLDGVEFKLSDYRGKVTAIVFWASWCGPCMEMVPHERKLVERMKNQPFVLIGVNGDVDRNKARQVTVKKAMTWRSFWNGSKGPHGPISRAWNVRGWPMVYVLDHKNVIRAKGVRGEELDAVVDQLVKEVAEEKEK